MSIIQRAFFCTKCGIELTHQNARRSFSPLFKANQILFNDEFAAIYPQCNSCLESEFEELAQFTGKRRTALFYFALRYDIPLFHEHIKNLPNKKSMLNKWLQTAEAYCEMQAQRNKSRFVYGEILRPEAIGHVDKRTSKEQRKDDDIKGKNDLAPEEARRKWTDDDLLYYDWERLEIIEAEQIADRPALDEASKAAIRDFCWATLQFEKAARRGDAKNAKEWQTMAEKSLSRENLLKRQASTTDLDRMAGMVEYIEKQIGGIPTIRELLDYLFVMLPELNGYNITADAADVMYTDLLNHYLENDGQPPMIELPPAKRTVDRLNEFVPPENQSERERNTLALIREYMRAGTFDGMDLSVIANAEGDE